MPAVSIALVRQGRLAWSGDFGVKDTGTNEPVDPDSVFAACSDTKPVFAYGVMKLAEKGLLNLDMSLVNAWAPFLMKMLANPSGPAVAPQSLWPEFARRFFAA
jgi:CubicO group peptidase (beta-lactamase class C family)